MRVQAITASNLNIHKAMSVSSSAKSGHAQDSNGTNNLSVMPCYYPVSFSSIQNSGKLRILFAYKLPCIYSGIPMIDPKQLSRWIKNGLFSRPASEVLNVLAPHRDSFRGIEAKVLELLDARAKVHPEMTMKQILNEVKPVYFRRLRKKQIPIFRELIEESHKLPDKYQYKFRQLMDETSKKLNEKPIVVPFSSYEFKYKLSKIKDDIHNGSDVKSKKVMNKLIKEAKRFSNSTNANTIENQKKVLTFLDIILRKSVLKNNAQLRDLLDTSYSRLNDDKIVVPFSRKAFLYDLARIIEDLSDKNLHDKMFQIAQKLPTSKESMSAYIMKAASDSNDKIGYRLIWPSIASVEHIHPRSCGGPDELANFAGATTRENSTRKSVPFTEQMQLRPLTPMYCQWYVDKLIELYHQGVFARNNINPRYISDFAGTIYNESNHCIKLNLSKMHEQI